MGLEFYAEIKKNSGWTRKNQKTMDHIHNQKMNILNRTQTAILVIICCLVFINCVSASGEITAYIGDTIPLSGYSYGSSTVYLFLTGPNLPVNGVTLNDISARADAGHFTEVSVDSNDHWEYPWGTNAIGGRLDAGTYTVWVVNRPLDRSQLANADYSTISLKLGSPVLNVNSPVIPGTLVLNTLPDGSSVLIDDVYHGSTPLTVGSIEPGAYQVTFSRFGYAKLSTPVGVESGKTTEVSAALVPLTGSLDITTSPTGAWILLDAINRGVTPIAIPDMTVGNHTLTVGKEGYGTDERLVTVVEGRTTHIIISLVPASPPLPDTQRAAAPAPATLIVVLISILLVVRHLRRE